MIATVIDICTIFILIFSSLYLAYIIGKWSGKKASDAVTTFNFNTGFDICNDEIWFTEQSEICPVKEMIADNCLKKLIDCGEFDDENQKVLVCQILKKIEED